jgi:hypothetical protein
VKIIISLEHPDNKWQSINNNWPFSNMILKIAYIAYWQRDWAVTLIEASLFA